MAKTQSESKTSGGFDQAAQALFSANPLLGPQAHQFWEVQEKILQEAEQFSKHWFDRRHTAARTALQATAELFGTASVDPGAAAKVLHDWQMQSAERVAEDVQEWVDFCTRSAEYVTAGEVSANKETLDSVSAAVEDAEHGHAIPV